MDSAIQCHLKTTNLSSWISRNFGSCNCNSISKESKLQDVQTQASRYHRRIVYASVCSPWQWPWNWGSFDDISQLGIQTCKYDVSIHPQIQIQPLWQTSWLNDKHLPKKQKKWHGELWQVVCPSDSLIGFELIWFDIFWVVEWTNDWMNEGLLHWLFDGWIDSNTLTFLRVFECPLWESLK